MSGQSTPTGPTPRKAKGVRKSTHSSKKAEIESKASTSGFSSVDLATKLDDYCKDYISGNQQILNTEPDLVGFSLDENIESPATFIKDRQQVSKMVGRNTFDVGGRTALNFSDVSIAGAKLVVDQTHATRSVIKRLMRETGASEETLMYPEIPEGFASLRHVARTIASNRRSAVLESFVDFQKQMQFKRSVLTRVQNEFSRSIPRRTRACVEEERRKSEPVKRMRLARTPKKQKPVNPLSDKKILDDYADQVASEVTENSTGVRGKVAPIPFRIDQVE
ncbi:hypothetical protein L596_019709 [Steinernema carpocapsae]|uniref:Uncharacterized protein n=1 Tax=Steinernema carpocapsae TaxID=34508 RepID=A0A4V6A0N8_STECR|nr:hypothetical protein L596_019709 [Steinernema carpocapsae]